MRILWIAIIISAIVSVIVAFMVENITGYDIFFLIAFFYFSTFFLFELLKILLGIRMIEDFTGAAQYIFGSVDDSFWERLFFLRESVTYFKGKAAVKAWIGFLFLPVSIGLYLFILLS